MEMSEAAKKAKAALANKSPAKPGTPPGRDQFLSSGVTPLNLGCTGTTYGAFRKGRIYRLIGKSQTSKTMMAMQVLCEAALSPHFKDHELIYDDVERGMQMDVSKFWPPLVGRLKAPAYEKDGSPVYSRVMDDFYDRVRQRIDKGKPVVWIEDSLDSLSHVITKEGRDGQKRQVEADTKMGDGKAKANSQNLRKLIAGLEKTGSILILVQHAKVNMGQMFAPDTTTGGLSPEYYSTLDIWLARSGAIKAVYKGTTKVEKQIPIGVMIQAHVKKNRVAGTDRTVTFPLYNEYGIDDIGSCVKFLLDYGHWEKEKGIIKATEFNTEAAEKKLIHQIEQEQKQQELRVLTGKVWRQIQDALALRREPKYGPPKT